VIEEKRLKGEKKEKKGAERGKEKKKIPRKRREPL